MVQRIDNKDNQYRPREHTQVSTTNQEDFYLVELFIKEFFYDKMISHHHNSTDKIIIRDGAVDTLYEMKDFSKEHENKDFFLTFINPKDKKVNKVFKINSGSCDKIEDKKTPKGHKKENKTQVRAPFKRRAPKDNQDNHKTKSNSDTNDSSHSKKSA